MKRRDFLKSMELAAAAAALSSSSSSLLGGAVDEPATKGNPRLKDIYQHIDAHQADHLLKIQEFLRQPSVSSSGQGMVECADMVRRFFVDLKFQEVRIEKTPGHPVVWAHYDAGAKKTLANYGMYDVIPIHDTPWIAPPFEARIVDKPPFGKAIIARGSNNTKAPLKAFLNALESILAVRGKLPINIMFLVEGEEELGSPSLPAVVRKYEDKLKTADACLDAKFLQNEKGDIDLTLGPKGLVYFELECSNERRGAGPVKNDASSRFAGVFGNPVWRLVQALSTMVDKDGMVMKIDGFMELLSIRKEEEDLADKMLERYDPDIILNEAEAAKFYPGLSKRDVLLRYLLYPTFNISGIKGGYIGPGQSTLLPHSATVKIDVRLVPEFDAGKIIPLVRAHLDKRGFQDITIRKLSEYNFSRTPLSDGAVQTLISTYRAYKYEPLIWPSRTSSGPYAPLFTSAPLSMPFLYGGIGFGGNNHVANEFVIVEGRGPIASLPEIEKFFVDFVYKFAETPPRPNQG